MTSDIVFDPLLPWALIVALAVLALAGTALALWRGLSGWALRGLAGLVLVGALAQPSWQVEDRAPLSDIVLMVVDQSASQRLAERAGVTEDAADQLEAMLTARPNTETRRIPVGDADGDGGTRLMSALSAAMAEEPRGRIAGIFLLSDGRLHDLEQAPDLPAPLHLLMTGQDTDWDRRLIVRNAPAFAILGEEVELTLRIEDDGAAPGASQTPILISVDGEPPQTFTVPIGQDLTLPITLPHGGLNVIQFTVPEADGELTDRNNTALVQINGVRDRLRVLLVSGEPHAGGRTWRNLLKSDSSVDLVHFTILRPPEKQDGVPVNELSLIAFPTRELFLEKIDDFDLIIFDRYKRRGILPAIYLDNVRNYVENGGAVLVAAGPDFASADSIYRSPLAEIMPAEPTARVVEEGYRPTVTDLGQRHPVTAGLQGADDWGRWLRQIEVEPLQGDVVMSGVDDRPLLILDRVGEGRVALLASDQAWLWNRGFEGGGPQMELLRRLAHWMMKEPQLEEEALWAEPNGQTMRIIRRSLTDDVGAVTVTGPDGSEVQVPLTEVTPGRFEAVYDGPEIGLYRLAEGDLTSVVGLGPAAPREFVQTIASGEALEPLIDTMRGGVLRLQEGVPTVRTVRAGRPAAGRGWIGITPREAYETLDVRQTPLLPAWLVLLLASAMIIGAWLREGRT
ncbi:glutamine amidotransferase [Tropicibacter naphthalenivorans]|uniref:Putative membrane protein n=1 Tax=Tropicibacter naphthalenivorans TaxID=441103 RepID=A0A0P1H093_9RHOB|nr:glutamine amidotransferase [Tropicibacter naphthalenivorans]CUH79333.1 putative membrane protein [Tropicibacter naphthalenivorans]SMC71380.1 Putative glutamine amidotransferase [Tropicibacter naphthalenivorans]